jgi:hypothetical protein
MKTIEEKLTKALKDNEKFFDKKQIKEFEEASKKFEELVNNGFITKRGNNLLSITDAYLHQETFNNSHKVNSSFYQSNI